MKKDSIYNEKEDNGLPSIFLKLWYIQIKYIMQQNPYLQIEKQLFENTIYHFPLLLLHILKEEYDEML